MGGLQLFCLGGIVVVTTLSAVLSSQPKNSFLNTKAKGINAHYLILTALLCAVFAWFFYLRVFYLLYSNVTAVVGIGYTDANVTVYGYYAIVFIFLVSSVLLFISAFSPHLRKRILFLSPYGLTAKSLIAPGVIAVLMAVLLWIVPFFVQNFIVSPNEITLERPYLENNIAMTRAGFSIDTTRIEIDQYSVGSEISDEMVDKNRATIDNVRLWDPEALLENLRQQQEIRLYYSFNDVDIDRYNIDGDYTQVMISVRELDKDNLDPRSRNWVSMRLKYTHGFGAVLVPVNEVLSQGRPNLLIKDIPPQTELQTVQINQPRIYYGELKNDHVYVNTTEPEFSYPVGDQMTTYFYDGEGGVSIGSFFRKLLYALRFDDYRLLISGYFTEDSRVMFRRNIRERAQALMPFLMLDRDPYPVITEDGRIVWIIDSYTTSSMFPYSQEYYGNLRHFHGNNYIRNSAKIVVDAFNGTVKPYIVDTSDVIMATYQRVFPELFRDFTQMLEDLQRHIRYPVDFFTVQSEMYTAYHMTDPETFYQREDMWEFATERYREGFQQVKPYYVMMEFPDSDSAEFALIMPFTPRGRNVMNAWMAGRSDIPNYGKLNVFTFPRGQQVFGPRQIEARIDQNSEMSQAITLWSQRGSDVIRGNLLVIPLFNEDSLHVMYVEPLFVQAQGTEIPEVRRVIVADQVNVVWAEMFDEAIDLLTERIEALPEFPVLPEEEEVDIQRARELLDQLKRFSAEGNFGAAGERLEELIRMFEPPAQ
ncbi:UPF0182 family protein [Chitinispirillales bacterium ANBcel5]|nr:UPF0182 family protein [Chitinispirillales bacterium ANBcel5]